MHLAASKKIVVLGMMSRHPVAGITWLTMQYLIGFQRLGYDVYYVETHGTPSFVQTIMNRFDMSSRWAVQDGEGCHGLSELQLKELYQTSALIINLHGCTKPQPEHSATGRLIYLETDPIEMEIDYYEVPDKMSAYLSPHAAFFTWGENYGNPDCKVPVPESFHFKPTRQPVIMDLWESFNGTSECFTTVGNWQQPYRDVTFQGEVYHWSKHYEFLKFLDLPARTSQSFELALASYDETDRQMLEDKGWRVRDAATISHDLDAYRRYVAQSRGEFTVCKDQNIRMRSGWIGDRSPAYLAAGRPVVVQDTGFSNVLPTGRGLISFSTLDDVLNAIDEVNSDYAGHCRAAAEIAREHFSYDVVLPRLLREAGV